jgi:small subunit ribosomal protein S17
MSEQSEVEVAPEVDAVEAGTPEAGTPEAGTPEAGTPEAGTPEAGTPEAGTPEQVEEAEEGRVNRRKIREGLVVSTKMEQTAVGAIIERVRHPRYVKTVQRTKRLYAHDPNSEVRVGDRVRLAETRPISKLKHWRIVEVLERAK